MLKLKTIAALAVALWTVSAAVAQTTRPDAPPYKNDPAVVEKLAQLPAGSAMLLADVAHFDAEGKPISGSGRGGPYARDYTNKMVYAPERQTAFYAGGNHGAGRMNDVWEYHLGSNSWHRLFAPEGGDHANFKLSLMFTPRKFAKNPDAKLDDREQANWDAAKVWWAENVVLRDGHLVTKGGGPLLVGHTWDTLVYEPNVKRMIHGTGAHCANNAWLHSRFTGTPLEDVKKQMALSYPADGEVGYRSMWMFDPVARQWIHYKSADSLANFRGMGATMCYIPDWKKTIFYVAATNVSPGAFTMLAYDAVNDRWEQIKCNGGKSISDLATKEKVSPMSEQQTAYSPKHKKMVAVLNKDTFIFDIQTKTWTKAKAVNDIVNGHDAHTIFAYDSNADLFLLAHPRSGKLAGYSLVEDKWQELTPAGDPMPKPKYGNGKGYYDPTYNALVLQIANTNRFWIYRHAATAGK